MKQSEQGIGNMLLGVRWAIRYGQWVLGITFINLSNRVSIKNDVSLV